MHMHENIFATNCLLKFGKAVPITYEAKPCGSRLEIHPHRQPSKLLPVLLITNQSKAQFNILSNLWHSSIAPAKEINKNHKHITTINHKIGYIGRVLDISKFEDLICKFFIGTNMWSVRYETTYTTDYLRSRR